MEYELITHVSITSKPRRSQTPEKTLKLFFLSHLRVISLLIKSLTLSRHMRKDLKRAQH